MHLDQLFSKMTRALEQEQSALQKPEPSSHRIFKVEGFGEFDETIIYGARLNPPITLPVGLPVAVDDLLNHVERPLRAANIVAQEKGMTYFASKSFTHLGCPTNLLIDGDLLPVTLIEGLRSFQHRKAIANPGLIAKAFGLQTEADSRLPFEIEGVEGQVDAAMRQVVSFVWGPPNTDAPGFAAACAKKLWSEGKSVLILAPNGKRVAEVLRSLTNASVFTAACGTDAMIYAGVAEAADAKQLDAFSPSATIRRNKPELFKLLEELERKISTWPNRLAADATPADHSAAPLAELEVEYNQLIIHLQTLRKAAITKAQVVLATVGDAIFNDLLYERQYAAVILMDAQDVLLPAVAFAACLAQKQMLIVGDFRQTPNLVTLRTEEAAKWLRPDIFTFAGVTAKAERGETDPRLITLESGCGMTHPTIIRVVKEVAYPGQRETQEAPDARATEIAALAPEPGDAMVFYDTSELIPHTQVAGSGGSRSNIISAAVSVSVAHSLSSHPNVTTILATPYADQSKLHRNLVRAMGIQNPVEVTMLHRCSLPPRDCVIIDLVESSSGTSVGYPLRGDRRSDAMRHMTSALTAARGKIILVGDADFLLHRLPHDAVLRSYLEAMCNNHIPFKKFPMDLLPQPQNPHLDGVSFEFDFDRGWEAIYADIKSARKRIIWNWPWPNVTDVFTGSSASLLLPENLRRGLMTTPDGLNQQILLEKGFRIAGCRRPETAVSIDGDTFWLTAISAGDAKRPFVRVRGRAAVLHLRELFGMNEAFDESQKQGSEHAL